MVKKKLASDEGSSNGARPKWGGPFKIFSIKTNKFVLLKISQSFPACSRFHNSSCLAVWEQVCDAKSLENSTCEREAAHVRRLAPMPSLHSLSCKNFSCLGAYYSQAQAGPAHGCLAVAIMLRNQLTNAPHLPLYLLIMSIANFFTFVVG